MRDYLALHHGSKFDNAFGKGTGKAIMHATAGRYHTDVIPIGPSRTDSMHQYHRHRRDYPTTFGCPEDQAANKPRGVQGARRLQDRGR